MKKQNEKTLKKLSLKKLQMISITNLGKIKGGDGDTGGNNTGDMGQDTSIQGLADMNFKIK
ncbi:hypothetical protein U9K52_17680 [Chryseobacterium sp. MHB01]|uniref:hypothetical protein n=1 Tax=Chryseobacterium sp. MHB01 TaxID=3109433 RepID=UPI002AFF4C69|nr:hypothetical protein [Chryseobacterium sp. MHB01]MEA1850747.1 hypothetical protein [Chryseobacterium sp. MHB01]